MDPSEVTFVICLKLRLLFSDVTLTFHLLTCCKCNKYAHENKMNDPLHHPTIKSHNQRLFQINAVLFLHTYDT